ncbi:MAG: DUF1801 domain-containing protein [Ignavibacteriaceae bacterium]|nr:DUF1801 domain-containing protein [Ignavibacteriaceae bacterium]
MAKTNFKSVDQYIKSFPEDVQIILKLVRDAIKSEAPKSVETINYGIPTFKLNGNLVHFAAFKNHIGFYPTPGAIKKFRIELSDYKSATGSVQFPLDKPIPIPLIKKIVKYRVKENSLKTSKPK